MKCPLLKQLPPPPVGRSGWPWTEETPGLPDRMPDGQPWPRISIVTSSFNRREFIEETIRAVILQGYPNLEYLIVDGGSTDGTLGVIKKYQPFLSWFVSEKDSGEYQAVNKGFWRAKGDIVTFNSSDDIYLPGTFADVAEHYGSDTTIGAVVGGFQRMDASSSPTGESIPATMNWKTPVDLTTVPMSAWRLHQQACFYTSTALRAVGNYVREDLRYTGDRDLLYRVCGQFRISLSPKVYARFRVHPGSLSSGSSHQKYRTNAEYAGLHFVFRDDGMDGTRWKNGYRFLAKAHLNLARGSGASLERMCALFFAIKCAPSVLLTRSFWKTCAGFARRKASGVS